MDEERSLYVLEAEDRASSKIDRVTDSVKNMNKEMNSTGRNSGGMSSIEGFASRVFKVNDQLNTFTRRWNRSMSSFNRATIRAVREAGESIADFTRDAIDNFTRFSEQHAKTMGAMRSDYSNTDSGIEQFTRDSDALRKQALEYGTVGPTGKGTLYDTMQVSKTQTEMKKAGISVDDMLNTDIVAEILEFAQANDLDSGKAVEFAQSLGSQFKYKPDQWGDMLDMISYTADLSVIDVSDIVQSMKYAGGVTAGLDRPISETLAEVSMLGNFGLKGSQSGSGIQALITRLLTGDTTVITDAMKEVAPPKALKAFYDFSNYAKSDGSPEITYDDIKNGKFEKKDITGNLRPMDEVVDALDDVMGDLNDEEQAWFAKKFFGLYQMKAAYALINGDDSQLKDIQNKIENNSIGTNENKLDILLDSQYGQNTSLEKLWEGTKTDIGDKLSDVVQAVRDEIFNFLSNDGNYNIDFNNIRSALQDSADKIEEKYGEQVANIVRSIGDFGFNAVEIGSTIVPDAVEGISNILKDIGNGDVLGVMSDWSSMIENMNNSADGLPDELQGMADTIITIIDWGGKLVAFNIGAKLLEAITNLFKLINIVTATITAGTVNVNGGVTGGKGTGGSTGGSKDSGGSSTGSSSSSNSGNKGSVDTTTKGTGVAKIAGGVLGAYGGSQLGSELGSNVVEAFGGDKDDQQTGSIIGGIAGGIGGWKLGSWGISKAYTALAPKVISGAQTAYINSLYALDALKAGASGVAGEVSGSISGSISGMASGVSSAASGISASSVASAALPVTLGAMAIYKGIEDNKRFEYNKERMDEVINNDDISYYGTNENGYVVTSQDIANMLNPAGYDSSSPYAYGGKYEDDQRTSIGGKEYPRKFFTTDEIKDRMKSNGLSYDRAKEVLEDEGQREYDNMLKQREEFKKSDEDYFYKIQSALFDKTGLMLEYRDWTEDAYIDKVDVDGYQKYRSYRDDSNNKKLIDWYNSLGTDKELQIPDLKGNLSNKFNVGSDEWAQSYIDHIKYLQKSNNLYNGYDLSDLKPNNITEGLALYDDKFKGIQENMDKYLSKHRSLDTSNNGGYDIDKPVLQDIQNTEKSYTSKTSNVPDTNKKLETENNIVIKPMENSITLSPNIVVNAKIDKDGNVTLTNVQKNQLFKQYIEFEQDKGKKYGG